ncbi:MAG: hypothetical protein J6B00_05040, partial [Alphaproteobacteria bacterium]|nr:hypothetical protein [Alphaproteobacteria bacterium]
MVAVSGKSRTNNCYSAWQKQSTGLFLRLCALYVLIMYTAVGNLPLALHFIKPIAKPLLKRSCFQFKKGGLY